MTGRHIARDAAGSQIMATRYYSCPWALAHRAAPTMAMHRAVVGAGCALTEYIGGRPSIAALEALAVLDPELELARKALAATKGTVT